MLVAHLGHFAVISMVLAGCVETADDPRIVAPDRIAGCALATPPSADAKLTGVWIAPGGDVWTVGDDSIVGRRDAASGDWQWCHADTAGTGTDFSAVWGAADDDIWITGSAGTLLRWRGTAFDRIDIGTTADLTGIWGSGTGNIFVIGDAGAARHFDGTTWRAADVTADTLGAVWGATATDVWIGGHRRVATTTDTGAEQHRCEATIYRYDAAARAFAGEHTFVQEHGACGIHGLGGSSTTDVWAVGTEFPAGAAASFAFAAHRDGAQWSRATPLDEELTIERTYTDVAARSPGAEDGAWVTATGVSAVRRNGGTWTTADDTTADLLDLDTRGPEMFAVGTGGKILRWSDSQWIQEH